jgi:GH24 family phage-related lysozyme (muramidase)
VKPEVREKFPAFTAIYEGRIPWLYQDIKGLITIGLGCLVDPVGLATGLPFVYAGTTQQADANAIAAEWRIIKGTTDLAHKGAGAARALCKLRLPEAAIDELARFRLDANERILFGYFHDWEQWSAEAQLGVLSMAWAMGAGFPKKWTTFREACVAQDWAKAAENCRIREEGNPGIVPRNKRNRALFLAAAQPAPEPSRIPQATEPKSRLDTMLTVWIDEAAHNPELYRAGNIDKDESE